jgi:hypothetical protein
MSERKETQEVCPMITMTSCLEAIYRLHGKKVEPKASLLGLGERLNSGMLGRFKARNHRGRRST